MEDVNVAAQEAALEAVAETPKGEDAVKTEGQTEGQAAEGEEPKEEKSESAKRREREKAYRARLRAEAAEAKAEAQRETARRQAILDAGKKEAPPKEEDFLDPMEFAAAKAIWGAENRYREREANGAGEAARAAEERAKQIEARESAAIAESWAAQVAEAESRYADFKTVALSQEVPVTKEMGLLIATSDVGADVLYHLGQNRALAAQIAGMSQVEAARAIGRIEASLSLPKPRTETKAPDPISPLKGGAGATAKDPAKMTYAEFRAYREAGGKL